jgi:amino acid permease
MPSSFQSQANIPTHLGFLPQEASLFEHRDPHRDTHSVYRSILSPICEEPNETTSLLSRTDEELGYTTSPLVTQAPDLRIDDSVTRSSFAQTTFNVIHLFVGVGLLSLPHTFRVAGWPIGIGMILFGAWLSR